MRIVAYDPGKTIGFAIFDQGAFVAAGHLHSVEEVAKHLAATVPQAVIFEGFARGNTAVKDQIETLHVCGGIQAIAAVLDIPSIRQYPAQRTGYIPLAKTVLKHHLEGYKQVDYVHAIDATAHALVYMTKEGIEWNQSYWMQQAFPALD